MEGRITDVVDWRVAVPLKLKPVSVVTEKSTGVGSGVVTNNCSVGGWSIVKVKATKNSLAVLSRTVPRELQKYLL